MISPLMLGLCSALARPLVLSLPRAELSRRHVRSRARGSAVGFVTAMAFAAVCSGLSGATSDAAAPSAAAAPAVAPAPPAAADATIAATTKRANATAAGTATLPLSVHRVVFIGDSITHGGTYITDIETYFLTRHPERQIEFINVGLSSETVSGLSEPGHANGQFPRPDLHERLARVLAQTKPDFAFACYGMNDGIYLPLDADRFAKFRDGVTWLHREVVATGATIVHLTPPIYDEVRGGKPGYAATLDHYSDWLLGQRTAARWTVVDVHAAMQRAIADARRRAPDFTFSKDGVHPDSAGHWIMARAVLESLGARDVAGADRAAMLEAHPHGREIYALVEQRQAFMKLAWLTATGHTRPGVKPGLPLAEAQTKAAEIARQIAALQK